MNGRKARKWMLGAGVVSFIGGTLYMTGDLVSAEQNRQLDLDTSRIAPREAPLLVGAAVHFGIGGEYGYDPAKSAALLKQDGFSSYRDDLPWDMYDWPSASHYKKRKDRVFSMLALTKGEARPVLIVGHPNPEVPGGNPPLTDEGRAAFADYAVRAVKSTRRFDPIYEIWNEWNMNAVQGQPWLKGAGDVSDPRAAANYTALARAGVAAIKKNQPDATVLVGAVGMDEGWPWTKAIVEMGALKGSDGLSVHLYNHCTANVEDRTATEMVDRMVDLQSILTQHNQGKPFPVYVTEFGWPTIPRQCIITPQAAADNIAQFFLWSATVPWLKGSWVYQLKDKGRNPLELEDNFGLYDYDHNPKPAACATAQALKIIHETPALALERPFKDVFVLYGKTDKGMRMVAWTSRADVRAELSVGGTLLSGKPLCGEQAPEAEAVAIGPTPVVIDIGETSAVSAHVQLKR